MNGTRGTRGTGTGPVPPGPLSVKDAALYLHITPRAVRKRIHAGTLMGTQIDGEWQVYPQAIQQGRPSGNPAQGRRTGEPGSWTAELSEFPAVTSSAATMMEQVLAPLIAQIGDLREELGQEKTLRSLAERRAAELEQQLARQAAPSISMAREQPAPAVTSNVAPPPPPPPHPRSILGRVAVWVAKQSD